MSWTARSKAAVRREALACITDDEASPEDKQAARESLLEADPMSYINSLPMPARMRLISKLRAALAEAAASRLKP